MATIAIPIIQYPRAGAESLGENPQAARSIYGYLFEGLTEMNVRLDSVIADITEQTSMKILRAILDGRTRPAAPSVVSADQG